jgi:hypothetical protein
MNDQSTKPAGEDRTLSAGATRIIGVLLLICSGVLGYFAIYAPLHQARMHAAHIQFGDKEVGSTPVMAIIAVMVIFFPKMATWDTILVTKNRKLSVVGWLMVAVLLGIGVGFYIWFHSQLKALGYDG